MDLIKDAGSRYGVIIRFDYHFTQILTKCASIYKN